MNQCGREWLEDADADAAADEPDEWFRPVWADLEEETTSSPPPPRAAGLRPRPPAAREEADAGRLLLEPLAAAQDALARLDAAADMLEPGLREGLIARLAYAEAAGLLAARGGHAHPLDLALRDTERLGRQEFWLRGRPAGALTADPADEATAWLETGETVRGTLHLARLLRHLPSGDDPLATADAARVWLGPLGPAAAAFDADRFARWRLAYWPDLRRRGSRKPALLRAADAAGAWMEAGIADVPDAAQALSIAALLLRRTGTLTQIPLPVWAGWTALCAPQDPGALPRLRGDVAARLAPDGAPWPLIFLHLAAEAARAGSRMLARLRQVEAAGAAVLGRQDRRSCLPGALALLLRHPALTAASLARQLGITPQAALRTLSQLVAAGLASEITGRKSFRAFAIVEGARSGPRTEGLGAE